MKAVLISIQPKWCELIASGKKTVEVRKTKPKLETPFKCYIYCTKGDSLNYLRRSYFDNVNKFWVDNKAFGANVARANGKVIGEFVCDVVYELHDWHLDPRGKYQEFEEEQLKKFLKAAQLTYDEICLYRNGMPYNKPLYAWHITDIVIYDKPKELSEFRKICQSDYCHTCDYAVKKNGYLVDCDRSVKRPPQSYMFVEELKGETE